LPRKVRRFALLVGLHNLQSKAKAEITGPTLGTGWD
jgi:hypothetical protein